MTESGSHPMPAQPVVPSWFKQRQGKAEPVGDGHVQRLTAPNLGDAWIAITRNDNARWSASVGRKEGGTDLAATEATFATAQDAWEAAFELYRIHVVT